MRSGSTSAKETASDFTSDHKAHRWDDSVELEGFGEGESSLPGMSGIEQGGRNPSTAEENESTPCMSRLEPVSCSSPPANSKDIAII